jgi:hypothetical protein
MTTLHAIAAKCIERTAAMGTKGKRANDFAFEFVVGAAAALDAVGHPDAGHVTMMIFLNLRTHPFPLACIRQWAEQAAPAAEVAA